MKKKKTDETKTVKLIKKSNDLVEGRYRFDIWETRVFTKMLTMIKADDEDFKEYRIFLKDVVKDFGLSHKNSYQMLKDGAKGLTKKEIKIIRDTPEGLKEFLTHIAVGVDSFVKDGNYIDISFHPKMKPFLLQLQNQYLMYDIRNVLNIQSSFSVRIYELLKQYEKIGKRRFSVQELKEMLDISDKYPLYANFKQRVIQKAQEDLQESTDIRFTFEEIKLGKQVTELIFFIFKNSGVVELRTNNKPEENQQVEDLNITNLIEREVFSMVRDMKGANLKTVQKWLKIYPEDYVKSRIILVKNLIHVGQKIINPMGFIQSMMAQPNIFDPIEEQKEIEASRKQKIKEEQLQKQKQADKEQQIQIQKEQFEVEKLKLIESLFDINPTLNTQFLEEFKQLRQQENCPFIVELAFNHYQTNIAGMAIGSKEELIHNFKLGGSFGAFFLEWMESKFVKEFQILRNSVVSN
ncbi:replication initiation protein [Emticicia sp. 17c]|uniref:replication initiation protein n=1 Tax=Emticicia sp. 17c TaxID=3127704 RepID=UPI00301D0E39